MKNFKKISRYDLKVLMRGRLSDRGYGVFDTPTTSSCSNQQTQPNNHCLNLIGNPNSGTRCSYDCGCDGYGH